MGADALTVSLEYFYADSISITGNGRNKISLGMDPLRKQLPGGNPKRRISKIIALYGAGCPWSLCRKNACKTVRLQPNKIKQHLAICLPKYAQIEPHIMPISGPYSRSGSDHFPDHPNGNFT
jgi:hypothetical protein